MWWKLKARVAELEAHLGVLDTLARYGHSLDSGAEREWNDCFQPDATYEIRYGAHTGAIPTTSMDGADELAEFFTNHTHAPTAWHRHFVVAPRVTIDGPDQATVHSYFLRLDGYPEGPGIKAFGRCEDHFTRGADGTWRFQQRSIDVDALRPAVRPPHDAAAG